MTDILISRSLLKQLGDYLEEAEDNVAGTYTRNLLDEVDTLLVQETEKAPTAPQVTIEPAQEVWIRAEIALHVPRQQNAILAGLAGYRHFVETAVAALGAEYVKTESIMAEVPDPQNAIAYDVRDVTDAVQALWWESHPDDPEF